MTPDLCRSLLHRLQLDLLRARDTGVIHIPCERAALTLEALVVLDGRALLWTGGAK